jgi:hypothetical protein
MSPIHFPSDRQVVLEFDLLAAYFHFFCGQIDTSA